MKTRRSQEGRRRRGSWRGIYITAGLLQMPMA